MLWSDDYFSYFDWLIRLAKFRHGVLLITCHFAEILKFGVRRFVPEAIDILALVEGRAWYGGKQSHLGGRATSEDNGSTHLEALRQIKEQ